MDAYCVNCGKKTKVVGGKRVKMSNGGVRMAGTCSKCGRNVSRILGGGFFTGMFGNRNKTSTYASSMGGRLHR